MLSFEEYKEIIIQLKESGTRTICIIGEGEPTLYPHFKELVKFISLQGMKICLTTNGILLASDDELVDLLNEVKASVVLKVNSFKGSLQDIFVARQGYSSLRDKALRKLMNKSFNKETPTRLAINTLLIKAIKDEFMDIFTFCRENNISLISSIYMPTGRTQDSAFHGKEAILDNSGNYEQLFLPMDNNEISKLKAQIKSYDSSHNIEHAAYPAYISGVACTQLLGIQIDNQGVVWSCCARKLIKNGEIVEDRICSHGEIRYLDVLNYEKVIYIRNRYNGQCLYRDIKNFL